MLFWQGFRCWLDGYLVPILKSNLQAINAKVRELTGQIGKENEEHVTVESLCDSSHISSKKEEVLALQLSEISKTDTTRSNSYAERKMIKFMQTENQTVVT